MKRTEGFRLPLQASRLWVRLAFGFGLLLALMGAVVVVAVLQFRALADQGEQTMRYDLQHLLSMQRIAQHAQGHGSAMARLLTAGRGEREAIYPLIDAEYAAIDNLLAHLVSDLANPQAVELLKQVVAKRSDYREIFGEIVVWIESDGLDFARTLFNDAGQPALRALINAANDLLDHEQAWLAEKQTVSQEQADRAEWLLAALAVAALALSVLLAWRTTVSVARPLGRIEAAAHRIASGDYTVRVGVRSRDELGQVAKAMNAMAGAIATREAEIESLAYIDRLSGLPNRVSGKPAAFFPTGTSVRTMPSSQRNEEHWTWKQAAASPAIRVASDGG